MPALPLDGVRVLECGDTLASAYAGRLLADLGAEVVLVEPPTGHPLRHVGPFVGGVPHAERSAGAAYLHAGKRSVRLGAVPLASLARHADVVLRATEDGTPWITDDELRAAGTHLVAVDVSLWGLDQGGGGGVDDLLALAASGLLSVNATAPGDPASTPLRYRGELSSVHAACDAVLAVLGALAERRRSGRGQHIDVSAHAAVAAIMATAVPSVTYAGEVAAHDGRRGVFPWGFYATTDGHVLVQVTEDTQWRALLGILGNPEWGGWDVFTTTAQRTENSDVLGPMVADAIAAFTSEAFLAACHEHGVAASRINTAADLLAWPHLRARGFFEPLDVDGVGVDVPGRPWRFHVAPAPTRRPRAPRLGEHDHEVPRQWSTSPSTATAAVSTAAGADEGARRQPPLHGVRVLDLTWVWAGPYASMQLAHLGADVVKIEAPGRLDVTRQLGPWAGGVAGPDRSGYFNQYNLGKRSVLLDLTTRDGRQVMGRLVEQADVVIDNMRAGALERMGFGWEELQRRNPRIVAVSMTGFGESGPARDRMAYGSIIDALSGIASANGPPGGGPTDFAMSLPDPCAGIHAAIATVAALLRARATGVGERVECTMLEASVATFPWPVLDQGVTGAPPVVVGNRHERFAPHDVVRCAGPYQWVAVSVRTDEQFAALAAVLGAPHLATDERFATAAARRRNADALDGLLAAWAAPLERDTAADRLRAAGVPAEPVLHLHEVVASPVLAARNFLLRLPHAEVGELPLAGVAWRTDGPPMVATRAAPCRGAHTAEVLHDWLGTSAPTVHPPSVPQPPR